MPMYIFVNCCNFYNDVKFELNWNNIKYVSLNYKNNLICQILYLFNRNDVPSYF